MGLSNHKFYNQTLLRIMNKKIEFNKPFISSTDKRYINDVFKKNKFADGFFQKKCENFIKKKLTLSLLH